MLKSGTGFTELKLWKKSRAFRNQIATVTMSFPEVEKYRLIDQLIRSSRSITANIAEGHGRYHYQENIQFCRMARGSLLESYDHLICAFDMDYITEEEIKNFEKLITEIKMILNGYINYLKNKKSEN